MFFNAIQLTLIKRGVNIQLENIITNMNTYVAVKIFPEKVVMRWYSPFQFELIEIVLYHRQLFFE